MTKFRSFADTKLLHIVRECDNGRVYWFEPTVLNGFEINTMGVVMNPLKIETDSDKFRLKITLAQISQDVWAWGFGWKYKTEGAGMGCSAYPLFVTAFEAVKYCFEIFDKHRELRGVYSQFRADTVEFALEQDFQLPDIELQ